MIVCWLLCAVLAETPRVEVSTLAGEVVTGTLREVTPEKVSIDREGTPVEFPIRELLLLQSLPAAGIQGTPAEATAATAQIVVELRDRSRLLGTELSADGNSLTLVHPALGRVRFQREQVASVRLGAEDPAVNAAWKELQQRTKNRDYLVIRKGDVLDHLDGVVGGLDDKQLQFVLDGDNVQVNRSRAYGWIYADVANPPKADGIRVQFTGAENLMVTGVMWNGSEWQLKWPGVGEPVVVPAALVKSIDYSSGKVLQLSSIEPRDVEHTPYFEGLEWPYRRDRNLFGRPLKIGTRTFARGLAIHSKTRLVYRLGGEYRRLTGVLGLDPELRISADLSDNNARVTLRGDRKVLFEADVRAGDPPITLDLPVVDVIELEILVDFGHGNSDIGDRVHFGDLKGLK